MLLSFPWPDTDIIYRTSNPLLSSIVMVVALTEWFVYVIDNFACREILSASCRECSRRQPRCRTKFLLFQTTLVAEKWINSLDLKHPNIFQRKRPDKKDYRLLLSSLLLQLERYALCDFLLVHRLFSQHSVCLASWLLFRSQSFSAGEDFADYGDRKMTLFQRKPCFSVLKIPHRYNFSMSSSAIGGLCSVFASPCSFSSTHCAP